MKYIKFFVATVASLALIIILANLNYARFPFQAGDSAGYVDLLKRIYEFNDMRSNVFAAAYPIFDLTHSAEVICSSPLANTYEQESFFRWHSYGIAFPIAWVGGLLTQDFAMVAAVVNALSTFGIFLAMLLIARNEKFSIIEIAIFSLLLMSFTPLVGAISGQYYFDRLFIPLTILYCYLHLKSSNTRFWFLSLIVICCVATVSERASLMIGVIAIYLAIFDPKNHNIHRIITIGFGVLAIAYYVIWAKFFQNSVYHGSIHPLTILMNLRMVLDWTSPISVMTRQWLWVLLPMLLLVFRSGRYLPLIFLFLLPNLMVSVGGAEKVGYVTHYHSYYIPLLIFGALMGYSKCKERAKHKKICYFLLGVALLWNVSNIHNRLFVVGPTLTHSLSGDFSLLFKGSDRQTFAQSRYDEIDDLLLLIDRPNAKISGGEFVMPQMVIRGFTHIRIFPIGLFDSDYLLVESAIDADESEIILALYSDLVETKKIAKCIYSKIGERFVEIGRKEIFGTKYRLFKAKINEKN